MSLEAGSQVEEVGLSATTIPLQEAQPPGVTDDDTISQRSTDGEARLPDPQYVKGWRLHVLTFSIWISLFLSTIETTIVSTALVSITDDLHGFDSRDWVVTSYLLTYTGFLIIYAKFSDIFGRKTMFLLALVLFTTFSIVCGSASSMEGLIIVRAFQGMGGSGIFSMVVVIAPGLVPREKHGRYMAVISSVFAIASVLGPILGGAITTHSTWRWVFLLNAPAGATAIFLVTIFLPSSGDLGFAARLRSKFSKASFYRIDILGVLLLLTASVLLVFALEEGGTSYSWRSPTIISIIVLAGACWIVVICWEHFVDKSKSAQEPIFPLRLLKDRVLVGMLSTGFFLGFPFVTIVVNIPQRAQAVDGLSPVHAGLALLPLLICSAFSSALPGVLTSNLKVPHAYLLMAGAILQLIGVGLISALPTTTHEIAPQQYGYEAIMGVGFGLQMSTLMILAPLAVKEADLAVTMGAITQIRILGGTIGLAISSTILNNHTRSKLKSLISTSELLNISNSLSAIDALTSAQQAAVRTAFAEGYNKQMQVMIAFSGVGLLTCLLILEKKSRSFE